MKNKELIYLFTEELNKIKKEGLESTPFKVRAYVSVIRYLNDNFAPTEDINAKQIAETSLTIHMKNKLTALLKKRISPGSSVAKKMLFNEIRNIIGIGDKKARELIVAGLISIKQLSQPKWQKLLNVDTKIVLKVAPLRRIPYDQIAQIEPILKGGMDKKTSNVIPGAKITLVGSYRRHMPYSKDIDIMLVSNKRDALDKYLQYLQDNISKVYVYSKGADKMSLVLQFDSRHKFKADVFRAKPEVQYSMLLYSTGSKNFNVRMRGRAKQMGYLLNQNGLFDKNGKRVVSPKSREIAYFTALNMKYLKPEDR